MMLGRKRPKERRWHWIEQQFQRAMAQNKLGQDPIGNAGDRRILIRLYGDSLSMPRIVEGIQYTDSFPELLRAGLSELHPGAEVLLYNRSMGGAPIGELKELWENDTFYFGPGGDLLVVQVGVVDCAPRPLSKSMRRSVARLPFRVRERVIQFLHHNRARILRSGLGSRTTQPGPFAEAFTQWLTDAAKMHTRVYVINIAPTTPNIEEHSPGFSDSVARYNQIIMQACAARPNVYLIDVHRAIGSAPGGIEEHIHPDGHHITSKGHRLYSRLILDHEQSWSAPDLADKRD